MLYALLANLTALIHLLFVLYVLFGGFLALRFGKAPWLHLPAAAWGVWIELSGGYCPLTPLENRFRRLAGEEGYGTGFIENYILPLLYPDWLTLPVQYVLAGVVVVLNVVFYGIVVWRRGKGGDGRK
jgi:hypothetical protein